jgi:hypothetical protein
MPTVWENSYVDRLQTLFINEAKRQKVVEDIRRAIEPLILPDAAKVLTAIATDLMTGVQKRNVRRDVNEACDALQRAMHLLEAVDPNLDG